MNEEFEKRGRFCFKQQRPFAFPTPHFSIAPSNAKIWRSMSKGRMPYIVDGNNVMGQTPGWHRDRPRARRTLLEELARFTRVKKAHITVVFDGPPDPTAPEGSAFHGVQILYARHGSDADSRIEALVETSPDPRGLIVVTSDRRLSLAVRSRGARTVRSGEFRKDVARALLPERAEDGENLEVDDVDGWLRYFGEES